MNESTSYPGLDDSWFVGGTTESPTERQPRALRRADVMAELEKRSTASADEDVIDLDGLDDSWFDRPARRA